MNNIKEKNDITKVAFYDDTCNHIPKNFEDFKSYWQNLVDKVPIEFRKSTQICITSDTNIFLHVLYTCPQIAEKTQKGVVNYTSILQRTKEIGILKRLIKKYPEVK